MIERAFINYKLTGNDEVFRQQLKIFSSRVVIARQILGSNFDWLTSTAFLHLLFDVGS